MKALWCGAWLCALVLTLSVGGVRAETGTLRLSLPEARSQAARLLAEGQPGPALILAEGVLIGAPGDVPALILKSRALRDTGQNAAAVAVAREAWRAAAADKDRFFAALVMAQARASNDQRGIAQFWLRRAAQIAPDESLRAVAVRDFRHVRRTTPWRANLALSASPSDNINGAPKTNSFDFGGLRLVNPAAVPLSGVRTSASADLRYTILTGPRSRVHLGVHALIERVRLSDEAKRKVPEAENRDYREDGIEARMTWETIGPQAGWIGRVTLALGRDWRAGDLFADSARLELGYSRGVGRGFEIGGELAFEAERRHDLAARDAQTRAVTLSGTKVFDSGARLRLDLTGSETTSSSAAIARHSRSAQLSVALGKPVMGVLPQVALHWEDLTFDRALYGPDNRQDDARGLSVNLLMPKLDYMGFAPEVGVSFTDRRSNYSLFTSESTDLRLGIRSVF